MDIDQLLRQLRMPGYRYRTALLLTPDVRPAALEDIAAVRRLELFDVAHHVLNELPAKTSFIGIGEQRVRDILCSCAHSKSDREVILCANSDIIFAKLNEQQREGVFRFLEVGLPKPNTALLIALPIHAFRLVPASERRRWEHNERLVVI